jgi:hypothetical protein
MRVAAPRAALALVLAAAAMAPVAAFQGHFPATSLRADDLRVASIAYRLGSRGGRFCSAEFPLSGLLLHHLPEYDEAGRTLQIHRYALDRGPGVLATVEGSPAARAGLVAGDVLLDVNGLPFPDPLKMAAEKDRATWRGQVEASETLLEHQLLKGPAALRVLRAGRTLQSVLEPDRGCRVRIRLARSDQLNAFADGRYVVVTTRLLEFVESDDELATIIGHELAHNLLGHRERLDAQGVPAGLLRGFGKNASRVRATEEEADRLGLKLAWAAGYQPSAAVTFWKRLYAAKGLQLPFFRTHPSLAARTRLLDQVLAELSSAGGDGQQ